MDANRLPKQGVTVRNARRGATLIETVVVAAILVIAAAIAAPTLSMSNSTPLNAAADTVKAAWAKARARAIADGQPYRFAAKANSGKFQVAPDNSPVWDGSSQSAPAGNTGAQPPLVIQDSLPNGMVFLSGSAASSNSSTPGSAPPPPSTGGSSGSGSWTCEIIFMPDGTTQQDAQIAFGAASGKSLVLQIRSATGAATTSY